MINPKKLRRVAFTLAKRLHGNIQGDVLGIRHGHGSEIGDARLYTEGDDVRRIDWALVARTGETYVRDVIADRELTSAILVDHSASMGTGTRGQTRAEMALIVAAAFGYVVGTGSNRVGFLGVHGGRERWWKPQQGTTAIAAAVHQLGRWATTNPPGPSRPLGEGIVRLHQLHPRRGVAAVVSDFMDSDWVNPLQGLSHTHETVCLRIVDPIDLTIPNVGVIRLEDPETGEQMNLDTADGRVRAAYAAQAQARQSLVHNEIVQAGAMDWVMYTNQDPINQLVHHFLERRRLLRAMHGVPGRRAA